MGNEPIHRADANDATCPFLGEPAAIGGTHTCLAGTYPITINPKYAAIYCLSHQHAKCSLYEAAREVGKGGEVLYLEGAHGVQVKREPSRPPVADSGLRRSMATAGVEPTSPPRVTPSRGPDPALGTENRSKWAATLGVVLLLLSGLVIAGLLLRGGGDRRTAVLVAEGNIPTSAPTGIRMAVGEKCTTPTSIASEPEDTPTLAQPAIPTVTPVPTSIRTAESTSTSTPTEVPTEEPSPTLEPTIATTPGLEVDPSPSRAVYTGGLGIPRAEWEATYGRPEEEVGGFLTYGGGDYLARFIRGSLQNLDRRWETGEQVTLPVARRTLRRFLPADAVLVRRSRLDDGRLLEVYRSPSIVDQFPGSTESNHPWVNTSPGTILGVYRMGEGERVESVVLSVGDPS